MNIFNVRTYYRRLASSRRQISRRQISRRQVSRRQIMLCSLSALSLAIGSTMPISVSAGANALTTVGRDASTDAKAAVTTAVPQHMARSATTAPQQSPETGTKVNLNTASAEQLASALTGVGSAKAKAIVEYRTEVGLFRSIAELEEVKGIGPSIVALNKERISVDRAKR